MIIIIKGALICIMLFFVTPSIDKVQMVKDTYHTRNLRDTATMSKFLHKDFKLISIAGTRDTLSREDWLGILWCKLCTEDSLYIISAQERDGVVHAITKSRSQIDKLGIPPYKDSLTVYFKDDKIVQIERDTLPGLHLWWKAYDEKFTPFHNWLKINFPDAPYNEPTTLYPLLDKYLNQMKRKEMRENKQKKIKE